MLIATLSISAKSEIPINFQKAFMYPLYPVPLSMAYTLYPVPLSMAYPGVSKWEIAKSKVLELIAPEVPVVGDQDNINRAHCAFVSGTIAQLRMCLSDVPNTFEELIFRFIQSIPKGFQRIDIVADTYNIEVRHRKS